MSISNPPASHLPIEEILVFEKYEYFNNLVMITLTELFHLTQMLLFNNLVMMKLLHSSTLLNILGLNFLSWILDLGY
jgi:hypothetical protein